MMADVGCIEFKRGDTFKLSCTYLIDGVPAQLPDNVRSQIRHHGTLICELQVDVVDAPNGQYTLTCADSKNWSVGAVYRCDIEYSSNGGNVASTDTFTIKVVEKETRD